MDRESGRHVGQFYSISGHTLSTAAIVVLVAILAALGTPLAPTTASADDTPEAFKASLWPNVIEMRLAPGQSAEQLIRLDYRVGPPARLIVTRFDYFIDADGKRQYVSVDDTSASQREQLEPDRWAGAKWISVNAGSTEVSPGEERVLTARVTVPKDAEPGEHRAYLLIGLDSPSTTGSVAIAPQFAIHTYITVPGSTLRQVSNVQLAPEHQGPLPLGNPVSLAATFENAGAVSLQSAGEVVVDRWTGGEMARLPLPDERIVPGERARIVTTWSGPPWWELIGRYHARWEFADDALALEAGAGQSFWVVNWANLAAAIGVVVAAYLLRLNRVARASLRGISAGVRAFRAGMRDDK